MAPLARARILATGMVQGVAYRQSAVWAAERLGLCGWVRNLPDGRVEALAEGPREKLESFVAWCWRGPPSARVSQVEVAWSPAQGGLEGFRVVH
jgi:acylphosphatase